MPSPKVKSNPRQNTPSSFWARVSKRGSDECWEWTGMRRHKYGRVSYCLEGSSAQQWRAHRLAHYLTTGETPPVVMHTCDNPPCCNPAHLRGGTQRENVHDAIRKGRLDPKKGGQRSRLYGR